MVAIANSVVAAKTAIVWRPLYGKFPFVFLILLCRRSGSYFFFSYFLLLPKKRKSKKN